MTNRRRRFFRTSRLGRHYPRNITLYTFNERESPPDYVYETIPAVGSGTMIQLSLVHVYIIHNLLFSQHRHHRQLAEPFLISQMCTSRLNPGNDTTRTTLFRRSPRYHSDRIPYLISLRLSFTFSNGTVVESISPFR